jgi:hypothetical protein
MGEGQCPLESRLGGNLPSPLHCACAEVPLSRCPSRTSDTSHLDNLKGLCPIWKVQGLGHP